MKDQALTQKQPQESSPTTENMKQKTNIPVTDLSASQTDARLAADDWPRHKREEVVRGLEFVRDNVREVKRIVLLMQSAVAAQHAEHSKARNLSVRVGNILAQIGAGKRDLLTRRECRDLAIELGVSSKEEKP